MFRREYRPLRVQIRARLVLPAALQFRPRLGRVRAAPQLLIQVFTARPVAELLAGAGAESDEYVRSGGTISCSARFLAFGVELGVRLVKRWVGRS